MRIKKGRESRDEAHWKIVYSYSIGSCMPRVLKLFIVRYCFTLNVNGTDSSQALNIIHIIIIQLGGLVVALSICALSSHVLPVLGTVGFHWVLLFPFTVQRQTN